MYTKEQLEKYPYFAKILEKNRLDVVLDTLTGIVARGYILGFVRSLIAEGTPFTFAMLDLDNFKFINDTYGHHVGDGVLIGVSNDLIRFLDGYAVAGRFGGDEILIVNLRDLTNEEKKPWLNDFYYNDTVLRKNIDLENCRPFITGTIGCATYPTDASDFDSLFALIDKTLYRGKTKGRNCYIFYREELHKNLEIQKIAKHGLYTMLHTIAQQFYNGGATLKDKMQAVSKTLLEELRISDLYYVGKHGIMHAVCTPDVEEVVNDIGALMKEDIYSTNSFRRIEYESPVFYEALKKREVETVIIVRIGMDSKETQGYLICAEPRSLRIWQEDESAILFYLANLIDFHIRLSGEEIPE
ncbi:MAG: GGDEF domain-containing protein [Lachnospiraceae bacterium]|nr:GGDEF domain-containing protein [Lachnospiraceae bacterium]